MNTAPRPSPAPWLAAAVREGVLPEDAAMPRPEGRPWPVVLLMALGAWLAAIPLLGTVVALVAGSGAGALATGVLLLGAAVVLLRSQGLPVFVEQLALPALTVGGGALGVGLARSLPDRATAAVLCAIALAMCVLVNRAWLRVLMGAAAAALFMVAAVPVRDLWEGMGVQAFWVALHLGLAMWAVVAVLQERVLASGALARWAALSESTGAGWLLMVLAGLAAYAGMTMLVAGQLGRWGALGGTPSGARAPALAMQGLSFILAAGAVLLAGRRWPTLRQPAAALAGLVLAALAFFLPSLGGVLLVLALTATTRRWRLAGTAAFAAAWIVGAFYYQLAWPLSTKALVLAGAGAVLAALAWWSARGTRTATPCAAGARSGHAAALVAASAILTLAAANHAIWQKEDLIARGDKVFVRLAPVDPRSLMQGDFMRLNFALPGAGRNELPPLSGSERPVVIARRGPDGVAQLLRTARADAAPAPGEMRIQLTPKDGQWILVTDAWFFREGDAARFERARYGEFRVLPDGRALLVGMADEQLRPL